MGCFMSFLVSWLSLLILFLQGLSVARADSSTRQPNTTLTLPRNPPSFGFEVTEAFPGLTFIQPVCLASPPGETNRLFVVERDGVIKVITNLANPDSTVFLDLRSRVAPDGEGGLLGLAFHPDYQSNGYFFVYYTLWTTSPGGSGFHDRLSRFQVAATDPARALPGSETVFLNQFDEADDHNGGDIHFGPDGYLYVALGDEGGGHDIFENSQRINKDFFSGILRIDVDKRPGSLPPNPHPASSTHYAIPADNPFVGATNFNDAPVDPVAVRTEFWAVGLRNPWRMSFDPFTGRLFCGDVGQDEREEINLIRRGGNYGWSYREGAIATPREPVPPGMSFDEPLLDYRHMGSSSDPTREGNAVAGGLVYRGNRLSQLAGEYLFADAISGNIWAASVETTNASNFRRLTTADAPVAFGVDPSNGDPLIAEHYSWRIVRLVYNSNTNQSALPATLAATGAFSDLSLLTPHVGIAPYDLNVPFWSDYAIKSRWFSVPDTNAFIGFDPIGNWTFPPGTVWIKHFELELTNGVPESRRRLETRFLVRSDAGIYGLTYRWSESGQDATLVPEEGMDENFTIQNAGKSRTQTWHYPARGECRVCHTPFAGWALGFNTAQLNRFPHTGTSENQLAALSRAGYFSAPIPSHNTLPALVPANDAAATREVRVRSYLSANCSQCHQPAAAAFGLWDARFSTPLEEAGIVNGRLRNNLGDPRNYVIRPGSPEHSVLLQRLENLGPRHMPPLATSELNHEAISLVRDWITGELQGQYQPVITSIVWDGEEEVRLLFTGVPQQSFVIEASFNLSDWQALATRDTDATGHGDFRYPVFPNVPMFFRIVAP